MKSHFTAIRVSIFAAVFALCGAVRSDSVVDWYRIKMAVYVPRVYDNTNSTGYRKYQRQTFSGYLAISYDAECNEEVRPTVSVCSLENLTHKIGGKRIAYECTVDDGCVASRVNYIGNNGRNKFTTPTIVFYMDAEPNYNVGGDDEDNSLLITLAGHGSSTSKRFNGYKCMIPKSFKGTVSGTLGCGCKAYGHTSPTRVACATGASNLVDDVAPVHGTWSAYFVTRCGNVVWYR